MSVTINSGVPASASHESSLTTPPLILNTPDGASGSGTVNINDVIGLQAALDLKLNDTNGPVGIANVLVNGVDLNLLAGLSGYGLTTVDLQKLADINTATAAEIDFLAGATGNIQTQIDAAFDSTDFTVADQMIVSTGAGTSIIATISDVLDGTVGTGYQFGNLVPPTATVDMNTQSISNVVDPVNPQDAATKNYVDVAIVGGGAFLPLAGGTMTGALDMDGATIVLDIDGDTTLSAAVDDTVVLDVAGTLFTWTTTGMDMGARQINNMADPLVAQDATTKNYVDTNTLLLSGLNPMAGGLDMNGNPIVLDANADTRIDTNIDDTVVLTIGSGGVVTFSTNIDVGGLDVTNLPATPVAGSSAISRDYANSTYLQVSGGNSLSGDLDMGGNLITNIGDPTTGGQVGDRDFNDARYFQIANNLSEGVATTMRTNLGLATVAASGDYTDLINTPAVPANLNDLGDVVVGVPGAGQDGYSLTWNNGAGNFDLQPAGVTSVFARTGAVTAANGDYTASQIAYVPFGNIAAVEVQAAINELDTEKLARDGSQTMTGDLDMNSNQILNLAAPLSVGDHTFNANDYQSSQGGASAFISTAGVPTASTPTYSFFSDQDTGMWWNGGAIAFSVSGNEEMLIDGATVSMENKRVTNVNSPTAVGDAVNLGYLNALGVTRVLGSVTSVDLFATPATTAIPIYTLPAGVRHVVTQVIVIATSYAPGISPVDPMISIGNSGPDYNQIVQTATLSWGSAGSADQAVYIDPEQGAATPNAADTISVQVDAPASGTFTALTVDIYVLGVEL